MAPAKISPDLLADERTQSLLAALPEDRSDDPERWRLHELLAHLVSFHRRERKSYWWAYHQRMAKDHEEIVDDADCLGALEATERAPIPDARSWLHEYRFDLEQDTRLKAGDSWLATFDGKTGGHIAEFEPGRAVLRTSEATLPELLSIMPGRPIPTNSIEESIARVAQAWAKQQPIAPALTTLLYREAPRIDGHEPGDPIVRSEEEIVAATVRVVANMQDSTLAIQGPPGCGKSHASARAIAHLLRSGCRVGIASQSHHAIDHLMKATLAVAREGGRRIATVKVKREADSPIFEDKEVRHAVDAKAVGFGSARSPQLVGGTAWTFSHDAAAGHLDYLFIDEAGQVSLANVVAMAQSTRNLILVGDQMQLPQVTQGTHPGESGSSALQYLLEEHATIPPERGLFLPRTHRLHPAICSFISEAIYEGRLTPEAHTEQRRVAHGSTPCAEVPVEAGVYFYPVDHEGNVQESQEEVEAICKIVDALLLRSVEEEGKRKPLTTADILIVAPYNLQVRALEKRLPGAMRIGSVDKFQGQEAAVVIVSMCASDGDGAPRGLEFLLNKNRLNVAISRAKSLAVVVGSPGLAATRVTSVRQMGLVNLYCRMVMSA